MSDYPRRRVLLLARTTAAIVAVAAAVLVVFSTQGSLRLHAAVRRAANQSHAAVAPRGATVITVGRAAPIKPIPAEFLGLSLEFPAIGSYAGSNPKAPDPVLEQLIRNLAPGQAPSIRIGGDSTDLTWLPIAGARRPAGAHYALSRRWLGVAGALVRDLNARVILGIDLEADSRRVAAAEAQALTSSIARDHVDALELGNEPELYGSFTWDGSGATGRPHGYDFAAYMRDFSRIGSALPRMPLAGPAIGGPGWLPYTGRFVPAEPRVRVVTVHRYPLKLCFAKPGMPEYPTIGNLLAASASRGLAQSVIPYVQVAHLRGRPLRVDEMNTNSCGHDVGVSDIFASALWALDALFQMARVGVDGVNIHSYPGASYELFRLSQSGGQWRGFVAPEYYGLLMFAQAAPPDSRLLQVSRTRSPQGFRAWAVRTPSGQTNVVLINDGSRQQSLAVRAQVTGAGTFELLRAPSLRATSGVTLGGQSFGNETRSGRLAGNRNATTIAPVDGVYVLRLPAGSAGLLTFATPGR